MVLVVIGLAISVPLVVWGSSLILRLIERFPAIVYIGAGAIAWTSARMIAHDHWLSPWFEAHGWTKYVLDAVLVIGVCLGGWLMQRRRRRAQATA
jgi:predicted tellurium resistance membrane protein TerC